MTLEISHCWYSQTILYYGLHSTLKVFNFSNIRFWKSVLTHWGRVTHICASKLTIIGSDNGLSPGRRQAIIWTNAGILSTGPLGTNVSEILIEIYTFSFKKMHLKMPSGKWRPSCRGLNMLISHKLSHWRDVTCCSNYPVQCYIITGLPAYPDAMTSQFLSWVEELCLVRWSFGVTNFNLRTIWLGWLNKDL